MSVKNIQSGLLSINNHLVRMALLAEEQIKEAIIALREKNVTLAEQVKSQDGIIDDLQRVVEDQSIKLIATQQPVAADLRTLFTTIKIVTDVERMADYAVDIARIAILLKDEDISDAMPEIERMAEIACTMLRESIDAYTAKDDDRAYEITKLDDEVDRGLMNLVKHLYYDAAQVEESRFKASQLNFVAKYLERIGDHATNICEWTIYIVTGEYVELNV
ncbi:phosphate signaling complex protein PhoU [Proteiniclasticum sp. QWL-01]|uniref:phosphate signaling complex protein PhoU n=1 Tax=Proteiniclasticum sp. QWL-01 TaxID=3036945 RepID=UPI0021FB41BA|nr:phosphate signaling complex protein PhoU [Proteiniclasticum sp. QWL-01]UUM12967.1 phosphate signaling complex protein PhoU [Clostridiaceae bacterium HFYG-1003]WFF71392.1 phosphate signaling complex protein PhoU [Proteiniclasticum sp. QWL-01]